MRNTSKHLVQIRHIATGLLLLFLCLTPPVKATLTHYQFDYFEVSGQEEFATTHDATGHSAHGETFNKNQNRSQYPFIPLTNSGDAFQKDEQKENLDSDLLPACQENQVDEIAHLFRSTNFTILQYEQKVLKGEPVLLVILLQSWKIFAPLN